MRLAEALARRGFQVSVLTIQHTPNEPPTETSAAGVTIYRTLKPLRLGPLWGFTYRRQLAATLRSLQNTWDVVFCSQLYLHSDVAALVAHERGKTAASLIVNSSAFGDFTKLLKERNGQRILSTTIKHSALFVMTNRSTDEALLHGFQPSQLRRFRYMVPQLPTPTTKPSASNEVLYLGRLTAQKNVLGLIRSFENYATHHRKLKLTIVGDGNEKAAVLKAIQESPANHRIKRYGWTDDPDSFYARARAVVMFSRSEGLSNVMLESLAHGKPLLITDVSGAREALDPEGVLPTVLPPAQPLQARGGYIFPVEDQAALTAAFEHLEDDQQMDFLGQEAQDRIRQDFLEEHCVKLFLEEIESVVSKSKFLSPHLRFPKT